MIRATLLTSFFAISIGIAGVPARAETCLERLVNGGLATGLTPEEMTTEHQISLLRQAVDSSDPVASAAARRELLQIRALMWSAVVRTGQQTEPASVSAVDLLVRISAADVADPALDRDLADAVASDRAVLAAHCAAVQPVELTMRSTDAARLRNELLRALRRDAPKSLAEALRAKLLAAGYSADSLTEQALAERSAQSFREWLTSCDPTEAAEVRRRAYAIGPTDRELNPGGVLDGAGVDAWMETLSGSDAELRREAANRLASVRLDADHEEYLRTMIKSDDVSRQELALVALVGTPTAAVLDAVMELAQTQGDLSPRIHAVEFLVRAKSADAAARVLAVAANRTLPAELRAPALRTLAGTTSGRSVVLSIIQDDAEPVALRESGVVALGGRLSPSEADALATIVLDETSPASLRHRALQQLIVAGHCRIGDALFVRIFSSPGDRGFRDMVAADLEATSHFSGDEEARAGAARYREASRNQ